MMNHFETGWKTTDGIDIYAQGWEPDGLLPEAVVCLVHGIGEHSGRYAQVAEAFCRQGWALFGPDHRGHGRSGGPRGHFPSAATLEHDLDLHLAAARNRYPGVPLVLYGHSLGGIFVLYYGLKSRPDVRGIVATSPGLETALEKQPVKVLAAKVLGLLLPRISMASGLDASAISREKPVISTYQKDPLVHDRITLGSGRMLIGMNRWTLLHAGEMTLPLLLMHGTHDAIAFPSGSIHFAAPLGNKCDLVLWEGAFHELHNEPEREEVLQTMTTWIGKQLEN